jgi:chromosome segregation ATPase
VPSKHHHDLESLCESLLKIVMEQQVEIKTFHSEKSSPASVSTGNFKLLNFKHNALAKAHENLSNKLKTLSAEREKDQEKIAAAKDEFGELAEKYQTLTAEHDSALLQLRDLQRQKLIPAQVDPSSEDRLLEQKNTLACLENLQASHASLCGQFAEVSAERRHISSQLEITSKLLDQLKSDKAILAESFNKLQNEHENALRANKADKFALQDQQLQHANEIFRASAKFDTLQAEFLKLSSEHVELSGLFDQEKSAMLELKALQATLSSERDSLLSNHKESLAEVKRLTEQLSSLVNNSGDQQLIANHQR